MNNLNSIADELIKASEEYGLAATIYAAFGGNVKVRMLYSNAACETSIEEIDFSVRSSNALKRADLLTLGKVMEAIEDETLIHIRNLGKKSYNEILTHLLVFGYERLSDRERQDFFIDLIERNHYS